MRRALGVLTTSLLIGLLLLPAAAAAAPTQDGVATDGSEARGIVLAVGAEEEGEAPGPEPKPPDATENPAAPTPYDANFLWGASVGILVLSLLGLAGLGVLYYVLVVRPRREEAE